MGCFFDQLEVGERHLTERLTVTEAHVVTWASLTGDWVPLHVDAEFARTTSFGERIAHGPLTMSLALGLATRLPLFGSTVVAWLGLDELRATAPVLFGDTIQVAIEIVGLRHSSDPARGICTMNYEVRNQHDAVVMRFVNTVMFLTLESSANGVSATSEGANS